MPGPNETQRGAQFQEQLLSENLRDRLLRIETSIKDKTENLRRELEAVGLPPGVVEARVNEFELELKNQNEDWLLKALRQERG